MFVATLQQAHYKFFHDDDDDDGGVWLQTFFLIKGIWPGSDELGNFWLIVLIAGSNSIGKGCILCVTGVRCGSDVLFCIHRFMLHCSRHGR